jgi:ParB family chromosome partitioning protein
MALGRGLGELLGEVQNAYEKNTELSENQRVKEIDVKLIVPNPAQPRKVFNEEKLQELADSIATHGLLQPVVVIKNNDNTYMLIAGERRLRAHKMCGMEKIKANIVDVEEYKLRELALIENIQRDDLNVIELAYSYAQLINEHNLTHEDLSKRVSKSRTSITNTLRVLTLSVYVQQKLSTGEITAGHAKVLVGLDEDTQKKVADSIVGQKLSVRETEKLVKDLKSANKSRSTNDAKITETKSYNYDSLDSCIDELKSDFTIKRTKNSLKIEFKSQEEIDSFLSKLEGN